MGAAYSGISGATKVAQLTPRRENEGLSPAGTGTALASYEQPMPGVGAASPALALGSNAMGPRHPAKSQMPLRRNLAPQKWARLPHRRRGQRSSAKPRSRRRRRSQPAATTRRQAFAEHAGGGIRQTGCSPRAARQCQEEKVASAAGEPTKVEPAPKTAAGTQAATNEPAKTPSTETNPKVTLRPIAPSTNAEATKTASAEFAESRSDSHHACTSAKAAPTIEAAQLRKLVGDPVVNRDGEQLGELEKVVVGPQGQIQHLVIRHGGFFGLFANHSEIDWRNAKPQIEGNKLVLALTPEQVASAPAYSGG